LAITGAMGGTHGDAVGLIIESAVVHEVCSSQYLLE
jgi:hypothetical protein